MALASLSEDDRVQEFIIANDWSARRDARNQANAICGSRQTAVCLGMGDAPEVLSDEQARQLSVAIADLQEYTASNELVEATAVLVLLRQDLTEHATADETRYDLWNRLA